MSEPACLRIALAQINTTVGDLTGNSALIERAYRSAVDAGAALVLFPELALTGYPPEDLLLKPSFHDDGLAALDDLASRITRGMAIVGYAARTPAGLCNAAAILGQGRLLDRYDKCTLPNYGVFDEKRYFVAGRRCPVYACGPWRIAVNICEDLWVEGGVARVQALEGRAQLMLNLSASPFHARKGRLREELIAFRARQLGLAIAQTNLVGGQDELVFDGRSLAARAGGEVIARARQFEPQLLLVDLPEPRPAETAPAGEPVALGAPSRERPSTAPGDPALPTRAARMLAGEPPPELGRCEQPPDRASLSLAEVALPEALLAPAATHRAGAPGASTAERIDGAGAPATPAAGAIAAELDEEEEIYRALTLGLADYVRKNGARGVVIGLSGGIDSALTAVVAVDALGPDAVVGISMPSAYSSAATRLDARLVAENLGIAFHEIPITVVFSALLEQLRPLLRDAPPDVTEENLQARIRGTILMAFANKFGHLVLATGNKSEVAVGYCTLYGDMVGGFSVLKDVFKTQVYQLARWRNARMPGRAPIPEETLTRPPSAELKPDQRDTDSLPPYEILDPILRELVERDAAPRELRAAGFDPPTVERVFRMVQGNEYKRRQAAPGIKITPRAFGRDRRYPLTNRYRPRGPAGDAGSA
ncbi:MAG: NAD+ synthase [Candidatus Eisenbacteria bacterium]|uniref:Glutamine-dependent NAD(+) synthetase n=1 Tax=Eiseniibacteriota bacterium TaxID=2212470 RepID=A0A937X6N4_UNCEI|nr:NAD+ synthase [Candidatus Eisenbacteria bacterium]